MAAICPYMKKALFDKVDYTKTNMDMIELALRLVIYDFDYDIAKDDLSDIKNKYEMNEKIKSSLNSVARVLSCEGESCGKFNACFNRNGE